MSNGGQVTTKAGKGATITQSYGKDSSDYCGSKSDERGGSMGGSVDNLAHSLTGATPKQSGK
jgi:hypothetical protein